MADWHGINGMWVDRMWHPCCDSQCPRHPWPWPWIFMVKFWKCCISEMGWPIDMEWKGCESIGCYTHFVISTLTSTMTLTLDFQGQILKKSYLRNGMADWHGTKEMWVDRMLDSHCDFKLWPQPWPWLWILKAKYWNCCHLGMGGSTHFEWKGCECVYDVGCTMELTLGHGAWLINQPSNGSLWNSYSFQPVGQWTGYSFTNLGAEGCCHSLNALFDLYWLCDYNHSQTQTQTEFYSTSIEIKSVTSGCKNNMVENKR